MIVYDDPLAGVSSHNQQYIRRTRWAPSRASKRAQKTRTKKEESKQHRREMAVENDLRAATRIRNFGIMNLDRLGLLNDKAKLASWVSDTLSGKSVSELDESQEYYLRCACGNNIQNHKVVHDVGGLENALTSRLEDQLLKTLTAKMGAKAAHTRAVLRRKEESANPVHATDLLRRKFASRAEELLIEDGKFNGPKRLLSGAPVPVFSLPSFNPRACFLSETHGLQPIFSKVVSGEGGSVVSLSEELQAEPFSIARAVASAFGIKMTAQKSFKDEQGTFKLSLTDDFEAPISSIAKASNYFAGKFLRDRAAASMAASGGVGFSTDMRGVECTTREWRLLFANSSTYQGKGGFAAWYNNVVSRGIVPWFDLNKKPIPRQLIDQWIELHTGIEHDKRLDIIKQLMIAGIEPNPGMSMPKRKPVKRKPLRSSEEDLECKVFAHQIESMSMRELLEARPNLPKWQREVVDDVLHQRATVMEAKSVLEEEQTSASSVAPSTTTPPAPVPTAPTPPPPKPPVPQQDVPQVGCFMSDQDGRIFPSHEVIRIAQRPTSKLDKILRIKFLLGLLTRGITKIYAHQFSIIPAPHPRWDAQDDLRPASERSTDLLPAQKFNYNYTRCNMYVFTSLVLAYLDLFFGSRVSLNWPTKTIERLSMPFNYTLVREGMPKIAMLCQNTLNQAKSILCRTSSVNRLDKGLDNEGDQSSFVAYLFYCFSHAKAIDRMSEPINFLRPTTQVAGGR